MSGVRADPRQQVLARAVRVTDFGVGVTGARALHIDIEPTFGPALRFDVTLPKGCVFEESRFDRFDPRLTDKGPDETTQAAFNADVGARA